MPPSILRPVEIERHGLAAAGWPRRASNRGCAAVLAVARIRQTLAASGARIVPLENPGGG
jgi:hypothetical protein